MTSKYKVSYYNKTIIKTLIDYVLTLSLICIFFPAFLLIGVVIVISSGFPIFFKQRRIGKKGAVFTIFKFRTMKFGSHLSQSSLDKLNEADGPVFKIYNDPRFTKIGKVLSRSGLDELPQFFNILKGEMSLVGPRPLPVYEANKLNEKQKIRELVKPGIISTWVTKGSHKLKFSEWMKLDREYVENGSLKTDLIVIVESIALVIKSIINLTI